MALSATKIISAYIADTRPVPQNVCEQAKLHVADTLACILAGTETDEVNILGKVYGGDTASDGVLVPGWGFTKTFAEAAHLMGTAAHAYDFDDTSLSMPGHPSAAIIPALLVTVLDLSENLGKPVGGRRFIDAYIKGLEVASKVGERLGEDHTGQGWHTISTVGLLGAAAACAALRGLDASKSERVLGIAASQAGGILNNCGTMVKPLHCGDAARNGYMAAALAELDFTAGADALEGGHGYPFGFVQSFTGGRLSKFELPKIDMQGPCISALNGEDFELIKPGLEIKRYPCCQVAHVCIDGMKKIRQREDFDIGNVKTVICYVDTEKRMTNLQCPEPQTPTEARFSMNFTVATVMLEGGVNLEHFSQERLASNELLQNMRLVEMRLQDNQGDKTVDVEVICKDDTVITERGTYEPVGWNDVERKFENCSRHARRHINVTGSLKVLKKLHLEKDMAGMLLDLF